MTNRTLRRSGLAVALLSVVTLAIVVPVMASRLRERVVEEQPIRWAVAKVAPDTFEYFGAVQGAVEDVQNGVVLRWGDESVTLPMTGSVTKELPGLARYRGWFAILALVPVEHGETLAQVQTALAQGEVEPTLVAVLRSPPPGVDADTWGAAEYKDWRYTYYTLTPQGTIERFDEPFTYTYYGNEITETGYRSYRALERDPYTWQFVAAMHITPGLHIPAARNSSPFAYPNYAGTRRAMGAMGWTWPVAGLAILTLIVGGLMFAASFVSRRFDDA